MRDEGLLSGALQPDEAAFTAAVPEVYASTEAAVATHQFGTPTLAETILPRSLIVPLPTARTNSGRAPLASAANRSAATNVVRGRGSAGRMAEVIFARPSRALHSRPAAASVFSSLSTQTLAAPPKRSENSSGSRCSALAATSITTGASRCSRPQVHSAPRGPLNRARKSWE